MKKLVLLIALGLTFNLVSAQDSGFKIGVNMGAPTGDLKDFTDLTLGADIAYLAPVSEQFKVGATVGYFYFSGKKGSPNISFLPIAATAQYSIIPNLFVGADLGYGIGLEPSGIDGGFYYQPKIGYQIDLFEVYIGYKAVSESGGSASSISLGFNYKI